jgi:hypothetical protein
MIMTWPLLLALGGDPAGVTAAPPTRARPAGEPTDRLLGKYRLRLRAGGGYLCETIDFIATVAEDGTVAFRDPPRLPGPAVWPVLVVASGVKGATASAARSTSAGGGLLQGIKDAAQAPTLILSDEDLRHDPRHGPKMDFLEATAAFREDLRKASEEKALAQWRKRVEAVAGDRRRPAAERRRALFELWDECDESARGAPARAVVEAVVRATLPVGARDGYAAEELARLNRGRAQGRRFEPYAKSAKSAESAETPEGGAR